jgi:hypothetical protein
MLTVPKVSRGLVLFAHGSGSSRLSPRNQFVARVLQSSGLATLLFDLLDERETEDRRKVFDIELLAERLCEAADWVRGRVIKTIPINDGKDQPHNLDEMVSAVERNLGPKAKYGEDKKKIEVREF